MNRTAALWITAALLQSGAPSKPIIDNARVTVWDVASTGAMSVPRPTGDFVVVTVTPNPGATYHKRGSDFDPARARSIVIDLKDKPLAPLENRSGHPNAFPRPGVKKLVENDRVIVWDYSWKPDVPTPMHFHDKDVVVVYVEDGALKSTTPDGGSTVNEFKAGTTRFNARDRVHTELMTSPRARAIITELK